ncbi:MAG: hypothetical protein GX981_08750 [Tissierellia bacterium]|nr:hypothetical protein [Tissierellia bacterium]
MLGIVLNIIGLIFVIISFIFIKTISKNEMNIYEEILIIEDNIKNYSLAIENILNNFDELLELSLGKLDSIDEQKKHKDNTKDFEEKPIEKTNPYNSKKKIIFKETSEETDSIENSYGKIIELKKIGLTNEEIAKKLNIGIREVEVFLKMWNNR